MVNIYLPSKVIRVGGLRGYIVARDKTGSLKRTDQKERQKSGRRRMRKSRDIQSYERFLINNETFVQRNGEMCFYHTPKLL